MATKLKAIEATIDPDGRVRTRDPLPISHPTKVILTLVIEDGDGRADLALASEAAWARDWDRDEEDEAWASLQEAR